MSSSLLPSLTIARLQLRKGDLHDARLSAEEALQDALLLQDRTQWLEAARLFFQCSQELEEINMAQPVMDEVCQFLRSGPEEIHQAQAETLIGSWLLAQGKMEEAQGYIHSAIAKATQARDLNTLARALVILGLALSFDPANQGLALQQFDKVDVILAEIENPEIQLNAKTLRGYIYTQKAQYDRALGILWEAYEQAKLHGFHLSVSSILAQLARVYRDQKHEEQYKIYAELALKGIDQTKSPRLYKLISQVCPKGIESLRPQYDFQIDEASRLVQEKVKGPIDFKNQHILFDLALLFIKNPGQRYSKEDLVAKIWGQIYDPDLHDNLIYVSIKRLRTLIEPDLESPRYILRDRKGYYFNPQSVVQFKNLEEASL
ncbi:winged helix-turn-helix domain-containing protein [Bdellovibrio sp. HCB-110]|uniref:winged helix-turn-helix domain-containing protein n=1 Tax=Bdellovibrio sp. HCB-110 TaxID=3391182 RepID=UPI0039B6853B